MEVLTFKRGRWLTPLLLAVSLLCLWLANELLSNNISIIIGWITLFFPESLGVAFAKFFGLLCLALSIGGFYMISRLVKIKYLLIVTPEKITCGSTSIPTSEVTRVHLRNDMDQTFLVIKSKNSEIAVSRLSIDESLESACLKINNFIASQNVRDTLA